MRTLCTIGLAVLLGFCSSGCGKAPPTLAGGKPVRHWVEALQSPDARLRKTAVFKLGNVGPADPAALPALLGALEDRDDSVRCEAILAVLKCGSPAREAIPILSVIERRDRNARVRRFAAKAIEKLAN
jgi:HEAT repeat protein